MVKTVEEKYVSKTANVAVKKKTFEDLQIYFW
jgi:hypothetical protein